LGYGPCICLEWLRKATKDSSKIVGVPAKIGTEHLQDTSLERYNHTNKLRHMILEVLNLWVLLS
jgi:hypothetical protein